MLDPSLFFKRAGKNQYIYRNKGVVGKYGYLLTYKEMFDLESLLRLMGLQAVIGSSPVFGLTRWGYTFVAILWASILSLYVLIYTKIQYKKIVGKPKRVYCGKLSIFKAYETQSKNVSIQESGKCLLSATFIFFMMLWLFHSCTNENEIGYLITLCFFLFACIHAIFISLLCIWYKFKSSQTIESYNKKIKNIEAPKSKQKKSIHKESNESSKK